MEPRSTGHSGPRPSSMAGMASIPGSAPAPTSIPGMAHLAQMKASGALDPSLGPYSLPSLSVAMGAVRPALLMRQMAHAQGMPGCSMPAPGQGGIPGCLAPLLPSMPGAVQPGAGGSHARVEQLARRMYGGGIEALRPCPLGAANGPRPGLAQMLHDNALAPHGGLSRGQPNGGGPPSSRQNFGMPPSRAMGSGSMGSGALNANPISCERSLF